MSVARLHSFLESFLCRNILIRHYKVDIKLLLAYHDYVLQSSFMAFYF